MVRVLIADDSAVFRNLLTKLLASDPAIEVVGEAANGEEAVVLAEHLKPDVITMDIHMPVMGGLEATRHIMQTNPRPIVIISASVEPKDVTQAFRALETGAVALLGKPPAPTSPTFFSSVREIATTVKLMAEVKVVTRQRPRVRGDATAGIESRAAERPEMVAIAASTGGPAALASVLGGLPSDLPVPVLVLQHIATGFEHGLVDWLQRISPLNVRLATFGLAPRAGEAIVAPSDRHLALSNGAVVLEAGEAIDGHRPSATRLFRSVAEIYGRKAMGVVLTGMGSDGAKGLRELKDEGGYVIAQDEATSVVYGMARSAVELGAVDRIVPLDLIADAIVKRCRPG